jgi:hypothetical protein
VRDAGAPAAAWVVLHSPPNDAALHVTVAWLNKTATRLPEASWVRFSPGRGAVDDASWRVYKIGGGGGSGGSSSSSGGGDAGGALFAVSPHDIVLNGSHSIHGVSEAGVSVASADGGERLRIRPKDAPLFALGEPRPFPNACVGPDTASWGVSACLHNNVWGTNYAMWCASVVFGGRGGGGGMFLLHHRGLAFLPTFLLSHITTHFSLFSSTLLK